MSLVVPIAVMAGLGAIALFAVNDDEADSRTIHLIKGVRYAVAVRITGPGFDPSMFPGFCNFSQPVITAEGNGWGEVQFSAVWCAENQAFEAPENMAIVREG